MLSKFSVKNFRSFGVAPLTLDMVASPRIQMHGEHVHEATPNVRLLRDAAIYGANAAGKSNVVRALDYMRAAVRQGFLPQGTTKEYCRVGQGLANEESIFEMQFVTGGYAYDYGFSCMLNRYQVTSEWLYELGESPEALFVRSTAQGITTGPVYSRISSEQDKTRFEVYADDFCSQLSSNPALLFISAVGRSKRAGGSSLFETFFRVYTWFAASLQILSANQPSPTSDFYAEGKSLDHVAEVLASFDTGVDSLSKKTITMDELDRYVDFGLAMTARQLMSQGEGLPQNQDGKTVMTLRSGDSFVGIEKADGGEPVVTVLEIHHRGSEYDFEFGDESDGTKRLFDFMDLLFSRDDDAVFVVDEIDRSLHPMLTQQLIKLFNHVHADDGCQLLLTTHENDIMSYDFFRKDEIWFVDRDEDGYSHLYSLDDFASVRTDSRLSRQYLAGRYGGIPVLDADRALAALKSDEG